MLTILSLQQVRHQREANSVENLLLTRVAVKHVLEGVLGLKQREERPVLAVLKSGNEATKGPEVVELLLPFILDFGSLAMSCSRLGTRLILQARHFQTTPERGLAHETMGKTTNSKNAWLDPRSGQELIISSWSGSLKYERL